MKMNMIFTTLLLTVVVSTTAQAQADMPARQAITRLAGSVTKLAGEVKVLKARKSSGGSVSVRSPVFSNESLAEGIFVLAGYDSSEAKTLSATTDGWHGRKVMVDRMSAASLRLAKVDQLENDLGVLQTQVNQLADFVNRRTTALDTDVQAVTARVATVESRQTTLINILAGGGKSMSKKLMAAGLGPSP